jgi:hypothetical protein
MLIVYIYFLLRVLGTVSCHGSVKIVTPTHERVNIQENS